ncbi:MAG: hypothetical protein Q9173_002343 [Seirophora scorigena]
MPSSTENKAQRVEQAQKYHELMKTPIYRLPAELVVNICERVDLVNWPAFMVATFHLLRFRGVIPPYPTSFLKENLLREEKSSSSPSGLMRMPPELLLVVGQTLSTKEKVHLILAAYAWPREEYTMVTHEQ